MDLRSFSSVNLARCEAADGFNHPLDSWSTSDWFTAVMGELGEAANVAKKLNRVRDGIIGNDETPDELRRKLGRELADTFIYLDLLAQSVGVNLSVVVPRVFDAKSRRIGFPETIETAWPADKRWPSHSVFDSPYDRGYWDAYYNNGDCSELETSEDDIRKYLEGRTDEIDEENDTALDCRDIPQ